MSPAAVDVGHDQPIRRWLLPDERILWEGKPDVSAYGLRGSWYLIPFSLLWGGFAIFWEATAIASHAPPFFLIWGVPFVLVGLYMIFGRILVARREARNTTYAITDRRILIAGGAFKPSFTALELRNLPGAKVDEGKGGTGSITFGATGGFQMPPGWPTMGAMYARTPAFLAIPDVRRVFDTYEKARTASL